MSLPGNISPYIYDMNSSYYLLLQEHLRNGGRSNADLSSPSFMSTTFSPHQAEEGSSSSVAKRKFSVPSSIDQEAHNASASQKK